jgi:carbamoyltransferase
VNILGISYLSDAGACIIKNGKLVSVINEERLNRVKLFYGIPERSIEWVLYDAGMDLKDVDVVVTQGYCSDEAGIEFIDQGLGVAIGRMQEKFAYVEEKIRASRLPKNIKEFKLSEIRERHKHERHVIFERNIGIVRQFKKFKRPVKLVEHHLAHAASAYYLSGWDDCYVMTADGWGEMESNILCRGLNGRLEKIATSNSFDSLGYFYGSVTKALGFIPHRHEGKVLGLAALGDARRALPWMREMVRYNRDRKTFEGGFEAGLYAAKFENPALEKVVKKYRREDVAAAVQRVLEDVVLEYVNDLIPAGAKVAVAGGIFANVLLNQKMREKTGVRDLFVCPQMGDGGISVGGALYYYGRTKKLAPQRIKSLYRGPGFTNKEVRAEVNRFGYPCKYYANIEAKIAELLKKDNCIMRFAGKMEYGPRALGNRTILYGTIDKTVNDWLNKALRRSEFMPFAPATLWEEAEKCYVNIDRYKEQALFMTTTFNCTPWMRKNSPGVVHVDGTARPQLVSRASNPSFHSILTNYHRLTGNPSLINTSFNMHEEPIVCTPHDALRAFQDSGLKYLAIENYLVFNDKDDVLSS